MRMTFVVKRRQFCSSVFKRNFRYAEVVQLNEPLFSTKGFTRCTRAHHQQTTQTTAHILYYICTCVYDMHVCIFALVLRLIAKKIVRMYALYRYEVSPDVGKIPLPCNYFSRHFNAMQLAQLSVQNAEKCTHTHTHTHVKSVHFLITFGKRFPWRKFSTLDCVFDN